MHFVSAGKPICGANLGDDMEYQWCSHGAHWGYVECEHCKRIYIAQLEAELQQMKKS